MDAAAFSSRTFAGQFLYEFTLTDGEGRILSTRLSRDGEFQMEGLASGKYVLRAQARTIDLIPSEPLLVKFFVARAPFPWTSTALAVLLLLALGAVGWGWSQNKRLGRSNLVLETVNRELSSTRMQLANETENERRRIASDLHDQTLADLRRLALLTDQIDNGSGPETAAVLRNEIEEVSTEIRRICEHLSPSILANVGLRAALQFALNEAVEHLPPECRVSMEFHAESDLDDRLNLADSVQIQIYRIVQEVLSNICRHSNATQIRMTAAVNGSSFQLTIEDNGRPFNWNDERESTGRGLSNIRSRASLIAARIESKRNEENQTLFSLCL